MERIQEGKEDAMKKKEANFELLRVLAMCMIIGLHYLDKGGVLGSFTDKSGIRGYLPWIFEAFFFPSVNLYVLISGYFLVEKEVRLKKVWTLWGQVFFYSVLLGLLAYTVGIADIGKLDIYRAGMYLFPVVTEHYWFVTVYILLYILLPFFNPVLQRMEQKQMRNTLLVLLLFISVSKSVLPLSLAIDKKGYDIVWFLCLYVTGAYYRRFGIPWLSGKVRGLLLYAASCMATFGCAYVLKLIFLRTGHLHDIITYSYSYNHIFCYLAAVGLFSFFSSVRICSKKAETIITGLGSTTFGVYLLHEHADFRYVWQSWLLVENQAVNDWFPLLLFSTMAGVFAVCACVEWMRKELFAQVAKVLKKGN